MTTSLRWTIADLQALPDRLDDTRYEVIAGELYVSTQPNWQHQHAGGAIFVALWTWSQQSGLGLPLWAPGVVFAQDEAVAPDVVWVSRARLRSVLGADGKLHEAPDLVVEVLSPGAANEQRDRGVKVRLYARQGVAEYWIADWQRRAVEVYRWEGPDLGLVATLREHERLESPLLPGFSTPVSTLFYRDEA